MPWGPGQSVTTGSIATNINRLFVFGATDPYKDLVSGTTFAGSLNGTAAFGSDAIGTYVESFASGDRLATSPLTEVVSNTDYSWFITFSRIGTVPNFSGVFTQYDSGGNFFHALQPDSPPTTARVYYNNSYVSVSNNLSSIATSTEFTVVITKTGTSGKYFYKGGSAPIAFTSGTFAGTRTFVNLSIGGWATGEYYPGRFRAYGRWTRALSDTEAQSMANNPQQILAAASTSIYEFQPFSRGVGRGIARGIA